MDSIISGLDQDVSGPDIVSAQKSLLNAFRQAVATHESANTLANIEHEKAIASAIDERDFQTAEVEQSRSDTEAACKSDFSADVAILNKERDSISNSARKEYTDMSVRIANLLRELQQDMDNAYAILSGRTWQFILQSHKDINVNHITQPSLDDSVASTEAAADSFFEYISSASVRPGTESELAPRRLPGVGLFFFLCISIAVIAASIIRDAGGDQSRAALIVSAAIIAAIASALGIIFRRRWVRWQVLQRFKAFRVAFEETKLLAEELRSRSLQEQDAKLAELARVHATRTNARKTAHLASLSDLRSEHDTALSRINQEYDHQTADADATQEAALSASQDQFDFALSQIRDAYRALTAITEQFAPVWKRASATDVCLLQDELRPIIAEYATMSGPGTYDPLIMPAVLPFPGTSALLFETDGEARSAAIKAAQATLLHVLTATAPGKARFTFFDPIGLGQNVAPFMHLGDFDEALVNGKAWTEPRHIEQHLIDLTEHMENVIQKYLRNQYSSIEEYNSDAGEIAEPYRVLLVCDFPVNFSEDAARRLVSIAENGPRCGVYTIVIRDTTKPLPHGFLIDDLVRFAQVVESSGDHFVLSDHDFRDCVLELSTPPDDSVFESLVKAVGEQAKAAERVEVPFKRIAAGMSLWWKSDSRHGLHVPLGPSGARRIQHFDVGEGTAQHALIVGKTGSGKSTLLHALIVGVAQAYSPDEINLYLIDFKHGVEFKPYATNRLPHARVVAIESEREFGLSVLDGLDDEIKRRSELFRRAGADSIADYRARSDETVPRILLLVDEFQEFFTEDDAIASRAAQLLDRLVRQGRSFGVHVVLGSQTLGGAYSLARTTIDQMAVRIALQCSETDSRLILGEDNPAARLLSRPGEAIYNAANGSIEGNNLFQVAWLPDEQRDEYLEQLRDKADGDERFVNRSPLVFEGNAVVDIASNGAIANALAHESRGTDPKVWLGDPLAIREPVAVAFARQGGKNLLMVGQDEEAAFGQIAASVISLAAQMRDASAMTLLDFSTASADRPVTLSQLPGLLRFPITVGRRRQLEETIRSIGDEVQRRMDVDDVQPQRFLIIHGLQRARDLRPDDGGYGFSSFADELQPASLATIFETILREGPEVGIHTIVWCDTMLNVSRSLDRRALREFSMRIAFQMSAEDSSNLIDTPAANKLGQFRALFYGEDEGVLEKYRPYGFPSADWLGYAGDQLAQRIPASGDALE